MDGSKTYSERGELWQEELASVDFSGSSHVSIPHMTILLHTLVLIYCNYYLYVCLGAAAIATGVA